MQTEIYRQHRQAQDKYVYFLLAAAGASIGFALNQTKDLALGVSQAPLGLAVLLWSISFIAGCRKLIRTELALSANIDLLKVQQGGFHPAEAEAAAHAVRTAIDRYNEAMVFWHTVQLWAFVSGGVSYIGWHVLEMARRGVS